MRMARVMFSAGSALGALVWIAGCGNPNATLLNDAFINFVQGGVVPTTPGPTTPSVLIRAVNGTANSNIQFVITVEKVQVQRDDVGDLIREADGSVKTETVQQTFRLNTFAAAGANELGTAVSCADVFIRRIGLGENLLPDDPGLFVGAEVAGNPGFGVPAGIDPIVAFGFDADNPQLGNFECGDTVIFRAISASGVPGGVKVQAFVLQGQLEPGTFTGPDTFANLEAIRETQVPEDDESSGGG